MPFRQMEPISIPVDPGEGPRHVPAGQAVALLFVGRKTAWFTLAFSLLFGGLMCSTSDAPSL